jgi:hypothetical protein
MIKIIKKCECGGFMYSREINKLPADDKFIDLRCNNAKCARAESFTVKALKEGKV